MSDSDEYEVNDGTSRAVTRRQALSATATGLVTATAGCAGILGGGDALRVMVWSGNYADRFEEGLVSQWEDEHDVPLDLRRGWDEVLEQIRNAPEDDPPFDVTVAEGNFYYYGRQDDLFEPLDPDDFSNYGGIMDFFTETRDPSYGMPVDGGPCNIIYREDADVDPDAWGDLFSTAVAESAGVGIDTGFWWYPLYAAAIGMDEAEGADEMYEPELHEDVLEEVEGWQIDAWASSGEDIWQSFDNGVIDVAQWYYEQTAFDIDDHEGLTHTLPEQTTGWFNNWCLVRGTDRREDGEAFIDFLMDADVQSTWAQEHPGMFTNEEIEYPAEIEEDLPTNDEEARNIAFPDWEFLSEYDAELSDAFTEMQQSS